ncbi:MAG: hypothetical protein LUG98_15270, partial [Tannerellaceae bacterium]|nr:hypothetical protein [Tannerellaceae bacterium]
RSNNRLYPKVGQIYLRPDNKWGRSHFYTYEKNVAGSYISTYTFNLLVLGFCVLLMIIAIFAEFPGKYLKRKNEY